MYQSIQAYETHQDHVYINMKCQKSTIIIVYNIAQWPSGKVLRLYGPSVMTWMADERTLMQLRFCADLDQLPEECLYMLAAISALA